MVHPSAYIDPTAQIIGNVHIAELVYVGPYAVIRADESYDKGQVHSIEIAAKCNIQDGVIIHALGGTNVKVDQQTSLSHGCIIHGPCTIGQNCFIGFKAVIFNAKIEDGCFISASAVVQATDLPKNTLVPPTAAITSPEDVIKLTTKTTQTEQDFNKKVVKANLTLTEGYKQLKQE